MHPALILRNAREPPAMAIVRTLLKNAMRNGNSMEKNVLRSVMDAVKNADIAKPGSIVSDIHFAGILKSLVKKRTQSIEQYIAGNRSDLADLEKNEISVLKQLLDKLDISTPDQLQQQVKKFITDLNIDDVKKAMSNLPKDVESQFKAPKSDVAKAVMNFFQQKRGFSTLTGSHENPLGLRRKSASQSTLPKRIPNVGKILLISSAKGGVGKSTVAANIAYNLVQQGHSVGLLDVDIFGPSIPTLLKLTDAKEPKLNKQGDKLLPLISHGIKAMSMGFLIPEGKSVSWRGLLVQKALQQLLFQVEWGPTEYLIVDMPPGTGDVQLTIGQQLVVDGAILVTTPQELALADAERGLDLFKKLNISVLGIVENMAYFKCPCCGEKTRIFGKGVIKDVQVLTQVPMEADIGLNVRDYWQSVAEKIAI